MDDKAQLTQYHDVTEAGHQIVVQIRRPRWLGLFTAVEVDGFVATSKGIKRPLAGEEKWDFV